MQHSIYPLCISSFENFSFSESSSGVIQVSVDAVLPFKVIWVFFERSLVIWMGMNFVGSSEVSNLGDAKFSIANL